jgi:hypothetical protein
LPEVSAQGLPDAPVHQQLNSDIDLQRDDPQLPAVHGDGIEASTNTAHDQQSMGNMVVPLRKPVRKRNKTHLGFVAAQPCLICRRSPCDAHHLKFAQPRSLGRKVSDEFTVPLCREHHQQLHRYGNEAGWWANVQIAPIEVAKQLWEATLFQVHHSASHS